MVIVTAAAITAGAYGAYKGGEAAVHGTQTKVRDIKKERERKKERKEGKEKQEARKEAEDKLHASRTVDERLSMMRGKHSTRSTTGEKKKNIFSKFRKGGK
mmetsp:Transcript_20871/g.29000  ORF Transcript_20871/g.29000 Transcript_20871/m.29000 type:complete len:101 (-) Transcript_20871:246-548(-)